MKVGDSARDSASKFTGTIIGLDSSGNPRVIHRALLQAIAPGGVGKVGDVRPELWVDAADVELLDAKGDVIPEHGEAGNAKAAAETKASNQASADAAVAKQRNETVGKAAPLTEAERATADKATHDQAEARIANEKLAATNGPVADHAHDAASVKGLEIPDPNAKPSAIPGSHSAAPAPSSGVAAATTTKAPAPGAAAQTA